MDRNADVFPASPSGSWRTCVCLPPYTVEAYVEEEGDA